MSSPLVKNWFGDAYSSLSPKLQELHRKGGVLDGNVDIKLGTGLAGFLGRRLSRNLNLPEPGKHALLVTISHSDEHLHWNRRFDGEIEVKSTFKPIGAKGYGYWIEKTGALKMKLDVEIKDGGWYWRCLGFSYHGVPLPAWLFPKSQAFKRIENDGYRFYVGFNAPISGLLVSYSGILDEK